MKNKRLEELKKQLGEVYYRLQGYFPHPHWEEERVKLEKEIAKLEKEIKAKKSK